MDKKRASELLVEYEDLILEFSGKMEWLCRSEHGKRYRLAVHGDMHSRTIAKLEKVHTKLLVYSGNPP